MSGNGKRRSSTVADKLRIVLPGMQPRVEVSDLCRREGLNPVWSIIRFRVIITTSGEVSSE
jgi:transposase-like protein